MSAQAKKDDLLFSDDPADSPDETLQQAEPWKILIVDDEPEVHNVTTLALNGFTFGDRGLKFIHAYSGAEAKEVAAENPDAALMLLDVVMEDDHAGLNVAKYVREELRNNSLRIVLRTGQPGQAPERSVIRDYDINDYKEKTELTSQKLFTLMHSCLRSYRDITAIEANKRGLEKVIEASASIFELGAMEKFTRGVMEQLTSLLFLEEDAVFCKVAGLAARCKSQTLEIVAGTGHYSELVGQDARKVVDADTLADMEAAIANQTNIIGEERYTGYFASKTGAADLFHIGGIRELSDLDRDLVELFSRNVGIAFENMLLKQEIEETQKEIVYRLGEAVETRSRETGNHVKRVSEYAKLLALGYGMDAQEAETVRLAAPLHDVGKISIPDSILNKPGKLTAEEWEIMKSHAALGHEMLKTSERPILQAGAIIALGHHEKWNGEGYPHGKSGEDIHIYGRIIALADVFDALGSDRCYKKAWEVKKILDLVRDERGKHFDPDLVDIFFDNLGHMMKIREQYPDTDDIHYGTVSNDGA